MSASVNKMTLVGNVGANPELRYLPDQTPATTIRVATTDKWKDRRTGEAREVTEWHTVAFIGPLAEIVGNYVRKGSQLYVEGKLRTRKWTDREGIERYSTEIRATEMQMLGKKEGGASAPPQGQPPAGDTSDLDDEIPF